MPIILNPIADPTDRIVPGEQLRQSVFDAPDPEQAVSMMGAYFQTALMRLVADEDGFAPMNSFICTTRVGVRRAKNGDLQIRVNGGIATPCGTWLSLDWSPLLLRFEQASVLWAISGVTKDSTGAPLGSCRVVAHETGRLAMDSGFGAVGPEGSVVGETISDGSGNYSIPAALNTAHQLTAYKAGAPDVAGITRNDVVPVAVG